MNPQRVIPEVQNLHELIRERQSPVMSYDLQTDLTVTIQFLKFPEGWQNSDGSRFGDVIFDLSPLYPRKQPKVYVSDDMLYEGQSPHVLYARSSAPPGFTKYCIHRLSEWNPDKHSLTTMFNLLEVSLENPHSKNPLQEA
ncbi:hypothetical protein [Haloferax marisrubri]|uniref:UBC core domain-containing protein n=1 Tax=Haloferax marisrubri TaxID=1544719 RepID=A0A2P4NPP7_9EURY|nr:hypothetical protein [Haloferax marisrubri]POG55089.1 hypothetical protein AUR65_011720 [Haloferax marisrubri]